MLSAWGSDFSTVTEKPYFPVSVNYYLGIKAQVKENDKDLLPAKHVCLGDGG